MIGWLMRGIVLAVKVEDCLACHQIVPHVIIRKTNWFTIIGLPVLFLGFSHLIVCTNCRAETPLSFLGVRRAMRLGRLPLERTRPEYEAAVREYFGAGPGDWAAFGVPVGSSADVLRVRYRELAKKLHPDAGGGEAAFSQMATCYQRLLSTTGVNRRESSPDPAELFDPIIVNPHRGFFDLYLKVWPVIALVVVSAVALNPSVAGIAPGGGGPSAPAAAPLTTGPGAPPGHVASERHLCWSVGTELVGCQASSGGMLFGTQAGAANVCYFWEPLTPGRPVDCYSSGP